eukprot:XP_025014379.1 uncharacterized protein LOC112535866 [Ricinus communis]
MANPSFKIGMLFNSFKQFKDAVKSLSIKSRNQVIFGPNTGQKCKKRCQFFIWAYLLNSNKQKCRSSQPISLTTVQERHTIGSELIPSWAIQWIIQAVKEDCGVEVSKLKAWRARNVALRFINGDETKQLSSLHDYKLELLRSNPGSTIVFGLNEGVFNSMYVCFAALREGFKFCRPFISSDGCWLKGVFGGQLLTTVGLDANDCIYSVVWQKGLIPAIEELFPNSEHRFYVKHVHNNFRKKFNSLGLKELVWNATRASYVQIFQRIMEKFASASHQGHNYMNSISSHHWSRSHFRTDAKCDMLLNNLCECFNNFILNARSKVVIAMNDVIRTKLMKRIHKNRDAMKRVASAYCPKILKELEKSEEFYWMFTTEWSGGERFQVVGPGGQFIIDKQEMTCTCRRWDLTGILCCHAVCAIWYNNKNPEFYIHDFYKVETYLKCYSHVINPTTSKEFWPKATAPPVLPPKPIKPRKGTPARKRRLEEEEMEGLIRNGKVTKKGSVMTCTVCGVKCLMGYLC